MPRTTACPVRVPIWRAKLLANASPRLSLRLLRGAGAVFGTVLTFTLYFWVLRQASTVALSLIAYVTPAIALVVGASLGEETVTGWTLGGLAFVLMGCALVLRRPAGAGARA